MKKIILFLLILTLTLCGTCVASSAAFLGKGTEVIANDVTLIKTGLIGENMKFCDADFKSALGISDFKKISIVEIPSSSEGTLMQGERRVYTGQTIKRRNLSSLVFIPKDSSVTESSFKFKVEDGHDTEILCKIKFIDKVNYAPSLVTDANDSLNVTTQTGISVYGTLSAKDPEGDAIEYIAVVTPKHGTLSIAKDGSGEFCYTPNKDYDGNDSFVFVARDEYGNYTKAQSVSLKVTERMSEVVYVDMENSKSYNAAVALTAMGIMSGSRIGDDMYFSPEKSISRAEFVAMAMKTLGIKADTTLSSTFFDDNDEIPKSLVGYVATAARCGIINGSLESDGLKFRPNDNITKCEAAIIMANLMEIKADSAAFSEITGIDTVPVWARGQVGAMYSAGIFSGEDASDINAEICREEAAEYLYRMIK